MPDLSTPPPSSPLQPQAPLPLSLHIPQPDIGEGPSRAPSPPARVPLQIELQEAPSEDLGQYAMQEQNLWYEEPPRLERGCGVWKMACKLRVWDIRRRYTPHTIRSVVAQEADDYFSTTGRPASPHPSLDTRHGTSRADIEGALHDHDGIFMSEEYYDWEIKSDDEDEDEDEDIDGGPTHTSAGEGEDDPDAEGDLEIDLEALDDPTFNPGLTSPPASPSELMGVGGRGGEMSAFYVPPVTDAPQEEVWNYASDESGYPEREPPASPLYHPQQQQQQLPPGEESLYRYTYPNPMQLQQHMPSPTLEHPHHPAPILPLPPPKLGSIPVYALRGLDLGMKVIGRGTPIDRARAAEWGGGCGGLCVRLAEIV
ncbi:hypothetical protein BD779DRAFT_678080 [Infundibulicybe gibba]|nr:hypothetical protein BD779DRAFT_678080 [Infundibulicybe gibba]